MRAALSWEAAFCIVLTPASPANALTSHYSSLASSTSSLRRFTQACHSAHKSKLHSTVDIETNPSDNGATSPSKQLVDQFLSQYGTSLDEGRQWADEFGFTEGEGAFYAIFRAIRRIDSSRGVESAGAQLLGLSGTPFYVPASQLAEAECASGEETNKLSDFCFHFSHLATALEDDFLDATVGSTDNRKGWQVSAVSQPTGSSFDDARMTLAQVKTALNSGTVIFNNIGAHIPRLAGPTLASTYALSLPGALNMYVTARGMRTSAPPHTDRQDVLVVQMQGAKRWRIFSPPTDGDVKPNADPFARGKGSDSLPLHTLLEGNGGRLGSQLLMDIITREGDVLFIPAGFPHTTDTVEETDNADSIHLTFNIDTHVWGLDFLSVRNVALKWLRAKDVLAPPSLSTSNSETNRYVGRVNQLPSNIRSLLMDALPLDFLDLSPSEYPSILDPIVRQHEKIFATLNESTGDSAVISNPNLVEVLKRIHSYGSSILEIHRDMYLAAVEEGRLRESEAAMASQIKDTSSSTSAKLTPDQIQRLSLFRVRSFFQKMDAAKNELDHWCLSGGTSASRMSDHSDDDSLSDPNWQFTSPVQVGDECEADLGGAFFAAKVSQVLGDKYNVHFFDGDRADGLERNQIKLLKPPSSEKEEIDTTGLTKKEIKRLQKKNEKKSHK